MSTNLFEMTAQQAQLEQMVLNGEIPADQAEETLALMTQDFEIKINDYCRVLRKFESNLDQIIAEKERLSKLEKEAKASIDRLKEWMMVGLHNLGKTSFDTGLHKGHIRKGSESVVITNESLIPDEYVETVVTAKVDKTAVKKAIEKATEEGKTFEGAEIQVGKSSLVFK